MLARGYRYLKQWVWDSHIAESRANEQQCMDVVGLIDQEPMIKGREGDQDLLSAGLGLEPLQCSFQILLPVSPGKDAQCVGVGGGLFQSLLQNFPTKKSTEDGSYIPTSGSSRLCHKHDINKYALAFSSPKATCGIYQRGLEYQGRENDLSSLSSLHTCVL